MNEGNALFYVCSLVEYIGRARKLRRSAVVDALGDETIRRIYRYADTFHCEQIAKVADDFIALRDIPSGDFDNVAKCRSWMSDALSRFNSDLFYQSRDYIAECYRSGTFV